MYLEGLKAQFHWCDRLSRKKGEGARQLLDILESIGATILHLWMGPVHDDPEGDIDKDGNIIVCPGLAHVVLCPDPLAPKGAPFAGCTFGYFNSTRSFDFMQNPDPSNPDQVDRIAHGELALAIIVYGQLRPAYGWIDEPGENTFATKYIKTCDLKYLFWANFFGPGYVERYGRDFLLGAPGWKKEELDDGGILYIVDESYMRWRTEEAADALNYFRSKAPSIRQYRSRGFERTEAMVAGDIKPKRKRRKPPS